MNDEAVTSRSTQSAVATQSQVLAGWEQVAPLLLIHTMKENKITYKDLEARLKKMGVHESAARLNRKVNRKSFSAAFFLMCMSAMGVDKLPVPTAQEVSQHFERTK